MKGKSPQQRIADLRRPPSLPNWVRLNHQRRDETSRRITLFALAKPRHALSQVYKLLADHVTLGVDVDTLRKGLDGILNPLVRRLGHEIADALLPWLDENDVRGIEAFRGMQASFPIGRKIVVPLSPNFVYLKSGVPTPVFIVGWSSFTFSDFQNKLLATMIYKAILTQEGFENSDALILFTPRRNYCKTSREVRALWVKRMSRLTDEQLSQQFDRYGNALDDAVPIILKELSSRGDI